MANTTDAARYYQAAMFAGTIGAVFWSVVLVLRVAGWLA